VTTIRPASIQTSRFRNIRSEDQPRFDACAYGLKVGNSAGTALK
jgi:hypothetical protein